MAAFHLLCWVSLALGGLCAVCLSLYLVRHPLRMRVMNIVWPVCALFGSVCIVWFFVRYGRTTKEQPRWASVAKGTLHCGSGCTLGDVLAECLVLGAPGVAVAFGWHWLFHEQLFATWILDTLLAFGFGIAFQYFAIVPMRHLSPWDGLKAALRADIASLLAWQVGMFGAMAMVQFWLYPRVLGEPSTAGHVEFWFAMQWAMVAGFFTSYPVNGMLIRRGIKESM